MTAIKFFIVGSDVTINIVFHLVAIVFHLFFLVYNLVIVFKYKEAKAGFFIPLFVYVVFTGFGFSVMKENLNADMVVGFFLFLLGFSITYSFGIKEGIQNKEAVVKIKEKSPFVLPILFFIIMVSGFSVFLIPRDINTIVQFGFCLFGSVLVYGLGMFLLFKTLQEVQKLNENRDKILNPQAPKKLLLINPGNLDKTGLNINTGSSFPPLGLGVLAALTPECFQIKLIDENFDTFAYEPADLVAITAFTSVAARAYEIAKIYEEKGVPVIMGGIHASMCPDEASRFVSCVVTGEAESVWPQVVQDFSKGKLQKRYTAGQCSLTNMPVPERTLFSDKYLFASVQTSRGCPMDCSFCSVTTFNGRKYRQRPVKEVLDELESIKQGYIFFVDDNLLGYGKDASKRAIELFRGMVERKLNKKWFCQAAINFGDDEQVLKWANKAGCKMVFLGLESPDSDELKAMNKKMNVNRNYEKTFKKIHKYKIAIVGAFINGSDAETFQSMKKKAGYILKNSIDVIQTTILTPLPGTRLFNDLVKSNRLLYTRFPEDWKNYDMTELTYRLSKMGSHEFYKVYKKNSEKFYSRFNLTRLFFRTWMATKSIEAANWALSSNMNYRNVSINN